jgi:hypothetical protein
MDELLNHCHFDIHYEDIEDLHLFVLRLTIIHFHHLINENEEHLVMNHFHLILLLYIIDHYISNNQNI